MDTKNLWLKVRPFHIGYVCSMTWQQAETDLRNALQNSYDLQECRVMADMVLEHITGVKRMNRRLSPAAEQLSMAQQETLGKIKTRLLRHEPLQYILGEAWFLGHRFKVNEQVLIPRPETEELVEWVAEMAAKLAPNFALLDVGTGSGCIPVSLKIMFREAAISAIDISVGALALASENATALQAAVAFRHLDFTDAKSWEGLPVFDIIVSNPPYIPWQEKDRLEPWVAEWEPSAALFVPNNDALLFYRLLAGFGKDHLKKGGSIFVECHQDYAMAVNDLFVNEGYTTTLKKDMSGNDRMIRAVAKW